MGLPLLRGLLDLLLGGQWHSEIIMSYTRGIFGDVFIDSEMNVVTLLIPRPVKPIS
jgi:hypothetical protein